MTTMAEQNNPDSQVPSSSENPDSAEFVYNEFSHFAGNCNEYALPWDGQAQVTRVSHELPDGRVASALKWGDGPPELVLLHGGAQNAHTWDTVALALRPCSILAIDLAGHGHSDWRTDGAYGPENNADDAAAMIDKFAPAATVLVGMSLGGLTANVLAATYPWLVERLVIIDVTPGVTRNKAAEVHAFIEGPQHFASFTEIFDRTAEFNPTRSADSLRRGILHNAHRLSDGSWEWNYDRRPILQESIANPEDGDAATFAGDLWGDVADVQAPYLLLRGALSPVVDDEDVSELLVRQPEARVQVIEGAGHSIQGDRPLELASILNEELSLTR
jgi:pimeloyl-ACP methyl ester carboxylesterase